MSGPASVLIVDDDLEALELTRRRVAAMGHSTRTAGDGREALALARAEPPHLVVTDVAMPDMDGFALARALRSDAALSLVPIVFLTAREEPDDVLRGFHLGADDYLPKSGALARLPDAIARAFARRASLTAYVDERARGAAFEGRLDHLGLASVLLLLESTGKTGTLRLQSPTSGEATLYLREGQVIGAELGGTDALRDEYVVYLASSWSSGAFAFLDGPVTGDDAIGKATTELILEAARRQDEEDAERSR